MKYAAIKTCDIANGPGVRVSLFVSGCTHHCPECFNEVAWDFDYGEVFDRAVEARLLEARRPDYVTGLTLLGGEPMEPENQAALRPFIRRFREALPDKTVWCYSGYSWEQLTGSVPSRACCEGTAALLTMFDVLVDGRFVAALHDITLRFRGSSNQRIISVPASLAAGEPLPWSDDPIFATHQME